MICNTKFNEDLKLSDRRGTEKDIAAIREVFEILLGFEVLEHKELKAYQMLRTVTTGLWQIKPG